MGGPSFDLEYDPNEVDGEMVVECWIAHGPRADDVSFDPRPGDRLTVGDHEEPVRSAVVLGREGGRVLVQVDLAVGGANLRR